MKFRKTVAGFSLIELMIALAVISILASIAYPNYMEYLQRARRAECASVLLGQANAMERRFSTTNSYVGALPGMSPAAQQPQPGQRQRQKEHPHATPQKEQADVGDQRACWPQPIVG